MEQIVAAHDAGADLVELRVDAIADIDAIESVLLAPRVLPFIITIRPSAEGGLWDGDDALRISMLERLGLLLPGFIDVEAATWFKSANIRHKIGLVCAIDEADLSALHGSDALSSSAAPASDEPVPDVDLPNPRRSVAKPFTPRKPAKHARPKNRLILSYHDFRHTPADLDAAIRPLVEVPGVIAKAAFMTHDATDALRLLAAQRAATGRAAAGGAAAIMGMGEAGLVTRVLGPKCGAALVYAAPSDDAIAAPGQPTLATLRDLYSWSRIDEHTRLYGVVGWPVSHSRSPLIHNTAMRHVGVNAVYVPLPVRPTYEDFATFMDFVAANDWLDCRGLSVTIPHKVHALRWLRERGYDITPLASRIGAVNTLTRSARGWMGDNSDATGAMHALETGGAFPNRPRDLPVAILGAGGAARAIAAMLAERGCRIVIFNRDESRAWSLAADFGCDVRPWSDRVATTASLIVNCTSVGMAPGVDDSPLPSEALRRYQIIFDSIYNPVDTRLLRDARARGARTISGLEMFLAQAAAQFQIWHGASDIIEVMRTAFSAPSEARP